MRGRWWRDPLDRMTWYQDEEVKVAITDKQAILGMDILCVCRPSGHVAHIPAAHLTHRVVPPVCLRRLHQGPGGIVTCHNSLRPMTAGEHAAYLLGGEEAMRSDAPGTERAE